MIKSDYNIYITNKFIVWQNNMFKKIYTVLVIWVGILSYSFALIQMTDGIFPVDSTTTSLMISGNIVSSGTSNNKPSSTWANIKTVFVSGAKDIPNSWSKILATNIWTWLFADIDFAQWIKRMYENWLTSYKNINDYRPYDKVTREEAAKMFSKLYEVEWLSFEENTWGCVFKDSNKFNSNMSEYIYRVCSLGIMKWWNWYFLPSKTITRAQWLAIVIRLFEWKSSNEELKPRYTEYYQKWLDYEIIPEVMKFSSMESWLSRYRLAKFIYTYHIKSQLKWNKTDINKKTIIYSNFWDVIPDTITENENKTSNMKVHLKTNQLSTNTSSAFSILLETNDKIKMVKITTTYKNTDKSSFVRYGDLYDNSDKLVGSSTFIYNNNFIKEWFLRFDSGITYRVTPSSQTNDQNIYDVFKKKY